MERGDPRRCFRCNQRGHKWKECHKTQCFKCKQYGHIKDDCQGQPPPRNRQDKRRHSEKLSQNTDTKSFSRQNYPLDSQSFRGQPCRSRSASTTSSLSSGAPGPRLPVEQKNQASDIRGEEAVNRVAETIFKLKKDDEGPLYVLQNKHFQDFQEEKNRGLLFIPKEKEELQRGDFDVIIIHRIHGYIHIEVKAFGDSQDHFDDTEKLRCLQRVLQKAIKTLRKGQRALRCLQPPGQPLGITNSLALPNTTRAFFTRALQDNPVLREELASCLLPTEKSLATIALESLCLCSDDLPPKDGIVDEAHEDIQRAIAQWWSNVTKMATPNKLNDDDFKFVLASFFNNEELRSFSESVYHTGENNTAMVLNDQQVEVIRSDKQYMFVTGPPGSGKTLVLAEKCVQWLQDGETVFLVFKHGKSTSHPATEVLWHFMEIISNSGDLTNEFQCLHTKGTSSGTNIEEFIKNIIAVKNNPELGNIPEKPRRKPEDIFFDEITGHDIHYEDFFKPLAIPVKEDEQPDASQEAENGSGINVVIDELTMRTIKGKRAQLISSVREKLPGARIWCAGSFPTHCPEDFDIAELSYPYRCPPKIQRLLKAVEPFCKNSNSFLFDYVVSPTKVPNSPVTPDSEEQYRFPEDGPDPVFFSHADHGNGEIIDCRKCAVSFVEYLKNTLNIAECVKDPSGKYVRDSDVLIVLTGMDTYKNMKCLPFTEFYRQLTSEETKFRVNIYHSSMADRFDPSQPGMSIMHVRAVAGVEKKVVVFLPCRQHQAKQMAPVQMTYADAVRRQPVPSSQQNPKSSQHGLSPVRWSNCAPAGLQGGRGRTQSAGDSYSRGRIEQEIEQCPCITEDQKQKLARLGILNLHWLWYAASRSLALLVIFHF